MPRIKIIATPAGEAPEWVRKEWVGLELPLDTKEVSDTPAVGVDGGSPAAENIGGYRVPSQTALRILRNKSPEAASYFRTRTLAGFSDMFVFGKQFCEYFKN